MVKYIYIILACAVVSLSAFVAAGHTAPPKEQAVALRTIGHELLLTGGDTTSRILPIKETAPGAFEIHFEKPIALNPDALADIVAKQEKAGLLPSGYVVEVHGCADGAVQYAYAIPIEKGETLPCLGRPLPKSCYYISISLKQDTQLAWLSAGVLPLFLFLGLRFYKKKPVGSPTEAECLTIGTAVFYPQLQKLRVQGNSISLTGKEARVLHIFAQAINEEIPRERLQKEVWEDEGVIVGRSLDMFISKLRKKLQPEPGVQLVSIHGRGYKLVVE
ncbi:hypothetical protein AM493_14835 [Flavobacterium akiainvivens]|uniref:OmpR/PhoB-type domain-containing protein n=1 Tax=Flavobacterium akiainvivens TaxID=1202724 RepID=A0A0M8MCB6_9FLAO|nr:winged helix-turn-helix domain-containing protein [Flavobacterium akiainvivens]KOS07175.1 hypothetical protein AM493_14835 [Flavobacterium akiainvivens]SFQ72960.1 Transcriptional regulatory protein, C terminal [Flavobacterium akiainvivens]